MLVSRTESLVDLGTDSVASDCYDNKCLDLMWPTHVKDNDGLSLWRLGSAEGVLFQHAAQNACAVTMSCVVD